MSFYSFNKKFLNIVIYELISINLHVYNLLYEIFMIIKTIAGNVIYFIFAFPIKNICFHYIFIFLL